MIEKKNKVAYDNSARFYFKGSGKMGHIIKGKDVVRHLLLDISNEKRHDYEKTPTLAIIRVGEHPSEVAYEKSIIHKLSALNMTCHPNVLNEKITQDDFNHLFKQINEDDEINGILVLKPIPNDISLDYAIETINPDKDVDCIGMYNMAKIYQEGPKGFIPCTAEAVMKIIAYENIDLVGKEIVIVGFGMVIGRPLTLLLLESGSTVTVCNEFTRELKEVSSGADILIVATGVRELIQSEHVKKDAIVIDVGINVAKNGRLVGDVKFDEVLAKASALTPVPGGVGTVTTYVLAQHVIRAFKKQHH